MDGAFQSFKVGNKTCVVQELARKFREDRVLKLARIANGKEPSHVNGYKRDK